MWGNMSAEQMSSTLVNLLPDYSNRLESGSIEQLQIVKFLNKVILFTTKTQAPPMLKVLSARYKNQILVHPPTLITLVRLR